MPQYRPTIGLEIHAELKTRTKMFCACLNNPDEETPNKNICPVCMAHPGTLPVINREAVRLVLLMGTALKATLANYTEFDRKNYFYPDIPKGYQISQYAHPLVSGGELNGVALTRVHLEEDTARSQHVNDLSPNGGRSLVDYNRAGVPLMELVTEPVIHDAKVAGDFARELQLLLRALGAGEANMEKGEMRVEANISIAPVRSAIEINKKEMNPILGTKVEVKNLNSFRSVERAIAYEIERQTKLLNNGEKIEQETRGWDENKQTTFSQRKKESSHDYRYFPDPDLPKLFLSEIAEFKRDILEKELPELPWQKRDRYLKLGLKKDDAEMFAREQLLGNFFDKAALDVRGETALLIANYIGSDIAGKREVGEVKDTWLLDPANALRLRKLIELIQRGALSSRGAKDVLAIMLSQSDDPEVIAKEKGLVQQSDTGLLSEIAQKVISANPQVAADYRTGKEAALQFLVGQGMKESRGSANPLELREQIKKVIG
ncbi:MAG: aspartyl-tRNA(Asn)/glutamyl-tRNA (Gln) amidotransferase subunit B [Parcubacteria group bacterium Gr01-1014_56]|nr:MAG: aspartyl-tRNA(Asn)/glutamyl-tRNA (Gln) amidotransferase subunit B [Parcubacteria group bacterium Gr01-1014_56]